MLKILGMQFPYKYKYADMSAELLFEENDCFIFDVEAPICWWTDFSGERTKLRLAYFAPDEIERQGMKFPIQTIVRGNVFLSYQQIVEICEDYVSGAYTDENSGWFAEREWSDFCETLLDIKGIRDLVQEEK